MICTKHTSPKNARIYLSISSPLSLISQLALKITSVPAIGTWTFTAMADALSDSVQLVNIVQMIESAVDLLSTSKDKDIFKLSTNLRASDGKLKWIGELDELKSFIECVLKLEGKWSSPGGNAKKFTCNLQDPNKSFGITWYFKKQSSLVFQGDSEFTDGVKAALLSFANIQSGRDMVDDANHNSSFCGLQNESDLQESGMTDVPNISSFELQPESNVDVDNGREALEIGQKVQSGHCDCVCVNGGRFDN